ncbi:CLCA-like protein [Mya arenaria]|uniref:Clathrin light chain n=1 Tax=Mya arenaria TaxID=6604 RepID=A0ABY7F6I5_MYAAR|nr:CLCA-like protein [Mya arenaria]
MADFDAFDSTPQQNTEEDPAADFLAREQDELKGLEDDNFGTEQTDTGADFFGDEQQGGDPFGQQQTDFAPSPTPGDVSQPAQFDSFDENVPSGEAETETGGYSAITQVDKQRAEPEKIKIWREENTRRIEKKDSEEKKRIEEWRDIAKKELDDWYKHHDEQLNKTKENNRESEAAFVADRDQTQPGEEWEKICRLCEFNPKNSKNTKDISRMRSILLQLKQTPLGK